MNQWRDKLIRFMTGRYGVDDLGKATLIGAIVLLVLAMLFGSSLLNFLALALIVYGYFRMCGAVSAVTSTPRRLA